MAQPTHAPPLSSGELLTGGLLAGFLAICDLWIKVVARASVCGPPRPIDVAQASGGLAGVWGDVWGDPAGCAAVPLWTGFLELAPRARAGIGPDLGAAYGPLWGFAALGVAMVATVLVLRWRYRTGADAWALGLLWGGALAAAGPRLLGSGAGVTDFVIPALGGMGTGIADLGLLGGTAWLLARATAELRA